MNLCTLQVKTGPQAIPTFSHPCRMAGVLCVILTLAGNLGRAEPHGAWAGLSEAEIASVRARFNSLSNDSAALRNFCHQFDQEELGDFLLEAIQDETMESYHVAKAFEMLGVMEYGPAAAPVRKIIEGFIQDGRFQATISVREWGTLHGAIITLGYVGGEAELPFLRQLVTTEFWEQRGGAPAREKTPDSKDSKRDNRDHFRLVALQAVAEVGTPEVVDYFSDPGNLPEDLASNQDWLLSIARRRQAGTFWTVTGDAGCVVPEPAGCFVRTIK